VLRFILVLMQSLSGSGHIFAARRLRLADKLELMRFDPWGMCSGISAFSYSVFLQYFDDVGWAVWPVKLAASPQKVSA